jgi:hypothetical protein
MGEFSQHGVVQAYGAPSALCETAPVTTPADQVRERLQDALVVLHRALTIAGTSGPIADPLKVRTQIELGRHHLDSALAALSKQP